MHSLQKDMAFLVSKQFPTFPVFPVISYTHMHAHKHTHTSYLYDQTTHGSEQVTSLL